MTTTPKPIMRATGLTGDASGLTGNVSGLTGDLDEIPTDARPCNIEDWVEGAA